MKKQLFFFLFILSGCLLFSCSGTSASNSGKDSSSFVNTKTPSSGDDMYYELTSSSNGKHFTMQQVTKMYISSKGDVRSEIFITNSAAPDKSTSPMVLIAHADRPGITYSIDDSAKTYRINHIDSLDLTGGMNTVSSATKIGEDKIMGFNCVHARIISNKKIGNFYNETDTIDLWKSNDVPMQAVVKGLMNKFESGGGHLMYSKETSDQLKQMGCEGFTVKLMMRGKSFSMTLQLVKVEHRNLEASLFQIPSGFTEDKNGL